MYREAEAQEQFLSPDDLHLFNEGTHLRLYQKLGSHLLRQDDRSGAHFAVWAPNAAGVSVVGDFNSWNPKAHPLQPQENSGTWAGFIGNVRESAAYKYQITPRQGAAFLKPDPFAFRHEPEAERASLVWDISYEWQDDQWLANRHKQSALESPISIYEIHLGSWMRVPEQGNRPLTYREIAPRLAEYVHRLGFTHVEFLPLMEHPFYGSWGYQTTGYFAPTSRYGTPQDLMFLIDYLHQHDIGVILDWVPSHFANDPHGLALFDGTALFEPADRSQAVHPDWDSYIFNYARPEVRSFLLSSAFFWLDKYHADGLRLDAVASMLYLDYSRGAGEWVPNPHGGRENLAAIDFLRQLNSEIYGAYPDVQTFAEESTAWPMVSRPTYIGGLGFGFKWDMGFVHDTLNYFTTEPNRRKYHHNELTFRAMYAFNENFVLPLSHHEVVHGKGSLLSRMPGDEWRRFASLRLLLGYMFLQPGKKLLFMGDEFAQWREWNHELSLDWHIANHSRHAGVQKWVQDLNALYRRHSALHESDAFSPGFEWIDCHDAEQSTISWLRRNNTGTEQIIAACNFMPEPRQNYRLGAPCGGHWQELLNSDAVDYGGSGHGNFGGMEAAPFGWLDRPYSLTITLPPLGLVVFKQLTNWD